jgi:putative membrane-bound dehydrogenase-like protein
MPTRAELEALKTDKDVARRRWAESMLATWNKMGRLPETYPAPIHTWQFGKELLWVFLGGEVVVDYQIRLEKELDAKQVWVAAYTDDVFAYVASERMRAEGGYEVDFSMVYYNQPGRWQSGTEDLIARRVKEILQEDVPDDKPRTPAGALKSIHVPPGFQVDLLAAEPEVADPVNVSFGHDGRIWVVEMSDYPLGAPGKGRVRYLRDNDGDGRYEESHVFLSELDYPSSAIPWRDGIIVIAAPDVFFAADRDGDGQPEVREVLLQGVGSANPQHRASGFEIGLDGWLNFTSGDGTRELTSTRSGKTLNVSGRDVCWNPDTGDLVTTSGHTQYIRARDEFGNWFGNVNNQPMFHYAIEDAYRSRGGMSGPATQHLLDPPVAPPVFPASRTKDRFNDLFTFNRFTSACSSIICREPGLGEDMRGAAFVCEPVHNLVARFHVAADGSSFKGRRFSEDSQVDWFASSDPFSRPVRIVNAPDGTLWVVDMVRLVIEHPQWIPAAWQERLNIRAGEGLGRIYRVRQQSFQPHAIPRTDQATDAELVRLLAQNDGAVRDLAAQQLLWRATDPKAPRGSPCRLEPSIVEAIRDCLRTSPDAAVRAQALGTLTAVGAMTERDVELAFNDRDARVRRFAVRQSERLPNRQHFEGNVLAKAAADQHDPGVLLQLALTLGGSQQPEVGPAIEAIAAGATSDLWLAKALALVSDRQVASALSGMIKALEQTSDTAQGPSPEVRAAVESTLSTLWGRSSKETRRSILSRVFPEQDSAQSSLSDQQVILLTAAAAIGLDKLAEDAAIKQRLSAAIATARQRLFDEQTSADQRRQLIPLLALSDSPTQAVMADVVQLLGAQETPQNQQAALGVVRRLKSDDVADALLSNWPRYLPDVRSSVSGLLLERRPWGEKLVAALESDKVKVGDLDAALLERLRSYGDRNLMARTARVLGQPPRSDRQALVNETLGKLSHSGDAQRGERLFVEHCAVCHRATPTKPIVGPPLENLSNWTEQQWVVAILDPNRAIEPKYHQYAVVTKEGQSLAGLVEDRSSDSLILAAADGQRHEIKLSEIEQLKDLGISLMPEGIETKLPPAALADLLAYVKTLAVQR